MSDTKVTNNGTTMALALSCAGRRKLVLFPIICATVRLEEGRERRGEDRAYRETGNYSRFTNNVLREMSTGRAEG